MDEEVHSRAASNSQASSSRGATRLSAIGLNSYFKPGRPPGGSGGDAFSPAPPPQQQQRVRQERSSAKGVPSHRRGGSWAASAHDAAPDLIDTVRIIYQSASHISVPNRAIAHDWYQEKCAIVRYLKREDIRCVSL
jgi:hypothetical protein